MFELVVNHAAAAQHKPTLQTLDNYSLDHFSADGLTNTDLMKELHCILEKSMIPLSAHYIGHMDSIPTLISCLGDFMAASINNNLLSLEMSPVFSQMEVNTRRLIANLFGYDGRSGGVISSGGSLANLQALAAARNHQLNVKEKGSFGLDKQPVILASEATHSSLQKAASVLGLGSHF